MTNAKRWLYTFALTFAVGAITAAMEPKATLSEMGRHGMIGLLPAITALKMTLTTSGPNDEEELKRSAAAGGK